MVVAEHVDLGVMMVVEYGMVRNRGQNIFDLKSKEDIAAVLVGLLNYDT